ncbi:uncharacterized protein PAN0_001c0509 [Moesziomyces antarcticus]|uniref:uncharacterized protein n=1 Tax=Pseudozyma antarctica TaxID=84753 RepID=UPI0007198252|nr:uncharacterized protein PAN0_001c0509 [Moesziomyces antarcticus]GAK62309.1 hypothetical protein PAN0_001c0509 [Moesziomyces antarcticus]
MQRKVDVEGSEMKVQRWTASKRRIERLGRTAIRLLTPDKGDSSAGRALRNANFLPPMRANLQSAVKVHFSRFSLAGRPTQQPPTDPNSPHCSSPCRQLLLCLTLLEWHLSTDGNPGGQPPLQRPSESEHHRRRSLRLTKVVQGSAQGHGEEMLGEPRCERNVLSVISTSTDAVTRTSGSVDPGCHNALLPILPILPLLPLQRRCLFGLHDDETLALSSVGLCGEARLSTSVDPGSFEGTLQMSLMLIALSSAHPDALSVLRVLFPASSILAERA